MASMTVLSIIQRFAYAVGIPSPSTAYANQSDDVQQMVELLNQEGRALSRRHKWQNLTFEASFTTLAVESQGTLASIIGATQELRGIVNETIYNRDTALPIFGPLSNRQWQQNKALTLTGPYPQYRIRGNTLRFYPSPTAGQTCYFEYISNCWCTDSTGAVYRRNVAADADLLLLDDEIMLAGLEWRWLRKKGLSYAEEFATYEALVADAMRRDGSQRTIMMDESNDRRFGTFIPLGSWPL